MKNCNSTGSIQQEESSIRQSNPRICAICGSESVVAPEIMAREDGQSIGRVCDLCRPNVERREELRPLVREILREEIHKIVETKDATDQLTAIFNRAMYW